MLFVLFVLMTALLLSEWMVMTFLESPADTSIQKSNKGMDAGSELPKLKMAQRPMDDYLDMVERPLFIEGRKPLSDSEEGNNTVSVGSIKDLVLIGIYSAKQQLFALFSKQGREKNYLKIKQGDDVAGWLLKEIQSDKVVLEKNGKQQTLMLRKPKAKEIKKPKALARKQIKLKS